MRINEFAPAGGGGSGNYFQALASAWYNGTFDTGSLQKGIKSQQDVERLLKRGIVCPDGKTRKLHIDYNSDFDGVEIYSDDYYEYGDHDDTIDSRTGQKWGPYDFMAFSDEDLSEGLNEFAPDSNDSGGEDDALHNYARMWWAGDEATQMQIERALAKMGWEIGEDEGGYDNGGVFVVRAGDENGNSYVSWAAEDLTEGNVINENSDVLAGLTDILKIAASRQTPQNPRYFSQQVKDVALQLKDNPATQKWSNYLDGVVRWADVISSGKEQYSPGFADEVHSVLGPATRAYQDALLNKPGVAEGDLNEKSTSQAQFRTMAAAAHNPEFAKKVGIKQSVAKEFHGADRKQDYKDLPKKADESKQAPAEKEADYGDDYQDMVKRVKKLAGLGPLKTQYDPAKRVYRNMPTAEQPKK